MLQSDVANWLVIFDYVIQYLGILSDVTQTVAILKDEKYDRKLWK